MDQVIHMGFFTPLDFSTKKPKLHNNSSALTDHDHSDNDDNDNDRHSSHSIDMADQDNITSIPVAQSPCSQLRNILSMKSPGANELSSTSPDTTATALNLTMPQQASGIGQNSVTTWTNSIPTDTISASPSSSSRLLRRKRSDSRSHSLSDDDDDNDSGRSCTSSTSPPSSNNSDCSFGIKKSPQPLSTSHASAASQQHFLNNSANQHKSHYHQPNILSRQRQQPQQQSHFDGPNLKMASSPKLARKSLLSSESSTVPVVTPIATKLSPMQLNFSPYTAFSQAAANLSPIPMLSQTVPTSSFGLPLQFHPNSPFFPSTTMSGSPASVSGKNETSLLTTFGNHSLLSPSTSAVHGETVTTNSTSGGKPKTTRPFKAYPKDPLTFPAVGLYGLPINTPPPGSNESIIHQQSNSAYAEFRRQMLSQTQGKGSKRLNQHHSQGHAGQQQLQPTNLLSPISIPTLATSLSTSQQMQQIQQLLLASESPTNLSSSADMLNYRLSLIERGNSNARTNGGRARGGTTSSGAEDSHSNSDEGFGSNEKSRLNGSNKSDQQLKDEAYWERRRKNNEAAKRSRDARRAKEDEIAIRAAFLEQENLKLRFEVCTLKHEIEKLKTMILKR